MGKTRRPLITETNFLFLLLAIGLLFIGSIVQSREIYSGLLITEYILVLLPNLLFLKLRGLSLKTNLRLNKISFKNIVLVILITIFSYPVVIFIQAIFLGIISIFKEIQPTGVPVPMDDMQYLLSFFVIAISPGICEEVMFRGTMLSAYDRLGARKSIIITGILFAAFHFTLLNFIGPLILGIIFGIMVHKTNSIYSSMIGHTVNNGIAVTILYLVNKYGDKLDALTGDSGLVTGSDLGRGMLIIVGIVFLCGLIVVKLIKSLSRQGQGLTYSEFNPVEVYLDEPYESQTSLMLKLLPLLISLLIFIYVNWKFILI